MKEIIMFLKYMLQVALLTIALTTLNAQEPPTPQEVANTVSNLWVGEDLAGLNSYVTNLYVGHSDYVPAILASSFHDSIYLGKFSQSTNKLARVNAVITNNPAGFTTEFKDFLAELRSETKREIDLHARMGTSPDALQSNASPSTVRSVWGTTLLPQINILFYAPATNAPCETGSGLD